MLALAGLVFAIVVAGAAAAPSPDPAPSRGGGSPDQAPAGQATSSAQPAAPPAPAPVTPAPPAPAPPAATTSPPAAAPPPSSESPVDAPKKIERASTRPAKKKPPPAQEKVSKTATVEASDGQQVSPPKSDVLPPADGEPQPGSTPVGTGGSETPGANVAPDAGTQRSADDIADDPSSSAVDVPVRAADAPAHAGASGNSNALESTATDGSAPTAGAASTQSTERPTELVAATAVVAASERTNPIPVVGLMIGLIVAILLLGLAAAPSVSAPASSGFGVVAHERRVEIAVAGALLLLISAVGVFLTG